MDLVLVGDPHRAVCSASTALVPYTPPRADVNHYYRDLGVPPTATRAELFAAYQDRGTNDARRTFCFKQLWNPQTRAAYDAVPPDGQFWDAWQVERINNEKKAAKSRMRAAGHGDETIKKVFASLGLTVPSDDPAPPAESGTHVAGPKASEFDEPRSLPRHGDGRPGAAPWGYSYFLKASTCDDVARLARWQQDLVSALTSRSIPQFAVGFHCASDQPVLIEEVGGIPVFLIHEDPQIAPVTA